MGALTIPASGVATRFPYGQCKNPVSAGGTTDVLPVTDCDVFVTRAGVNAMTLAAPRAGVYPAGMASFQGLGDPGDDGKRIRIISTGAFAHTVTTPANKINGSLHIATFGAAVANWVEFEAYNGIWYMVGQLGVTLS